MDYMGKRGNIWNCFVTVIVFGSCFYHLFFRWIYCDDKWYRTYSAFFVGGGIFLIVCVLWSRYLEKKAQVWHIIFAVLLFFAAMSLSAWWIMNSANLPQSDAKSIYDIALRAKNHDLLPIAPYGSYMSLWPFQSGLVLFMETIMRLIPNADEMTIQWVYLPFMALSLLSGYMVVRRIFTFVRTRIIWCILMCSCFPYYLYINNMYGEIPSMSMVLFSLWMCAEYARKKSWTILGLMGLGLAVAVAIRKNVLIYVIACVMVMTVLVMAGKGKRYLLVAVVTIGAAIAGSVLPIKIYEFRARNTMGKGVPAISYVAMGLQWSEGRVPGGWNGYHSDLYLKCNYDREQVVAISREAVKDSLGDMIAHPAYMVRFFYYKLIGQWAREDFGCLYETLEFYEERTMAAWDIYNGNLKGKFMYIMTVHQSIVYIGGFCFCILGMFHWREKNRDRKKYEGNEELWKLILLVTFIGGFIFSMIWEAGTRYVMPYFIMLIPYAADGLAEMSCKAEKISKVILAGRG